MGDGNGAGWMVIMSKPMAEEVAEKAISAAGYRVCLPRSSKLIRATRLDEGGRITRPRGQIVHRPAFRGYLFVELWPDQRWRDLIDSRQTRGVDSAILRGERPALLKPELIDAIRQAEDAGDFDEPTGLRLRGNKQSKRRTDINDGDYVRIETGPFASFIASVVNQDDVGRANVLVNIFGRETPINIEAAELELV